ncbi:hypothetical protein [Spiroplasma citri]|nr:hypothetical protein [Spiroplasma citri]
MWWNSYKILNPYLHPVLAPLLVIFSGIWIYGISTLVSYLALFSLRTKKKQKKEKINSC